jgi:hypothetical protein
VQRFNLKLRQEHFSKNLPLCPIDFATLEIERHETPATIPRAFPFHRLLDDPSSSAKMEGYHVLLASNFFTWTNLEIRFLE